MNSAMAQASNPAMGMPQTPRQTPPAGPPPMPGQAPAAPAPSVPCWMLAVGGQQYGPFDNAQMSQMSQTGQLTAQTMVWKQGMQQWAAAATVAELAALFQPSAPPAPGAGMPPMPGSMPPPMP